jgi:hypothetical protein
MTFGQLLLGTVVVGLVLLGVALLRSVRRLRQQVEQMQEGMERLAAGVPVATPSPTVAREPTQTLAAPPAVPTVTTSAAAPTSTEPFSTPSPTVVTAVLGGPLVKLAAFGYALRQALSVDNRRHLSRVVDQELRAARRRRRTAMVGARRTARVR